ncbi:hypothetical protein PMAC_002837 [Pneumocystis sp. 'macacae']|nr:hypothetical protein PMAC_002837 [Pneumocystis sp. 'macacae']
MCLRTGNSPEKEPYDILHAMKNSLVICTEQTEESSQKFKKSWESEVDSWEQLIDKPEKYYQEFSKKELSKDLSSKEKKSSQISLPLNSETQQTVMTNVLEISNMPSDICEGEIYNSFGLDKDRMSIKWVNNTKAQLCFPSEEAGNFFLILKKHWFKLLLAKNAYFKYLSSFLSIGNLSPLPPGYNSFRSSTSSAFTSSTKTPLTVFHKSTFLATLEQQKFPISDKRPLKTSTVAKRLITGVLGVRAPRTTKEKEYDETMIHQFLETLKEKEAQEHLKKEIWEKGF